MQLEIMELSCCHVLAFRLNCLPQHPVLEHALPMACSLRERLYSFIPKYLFFKTKALCKVLLTCRRVTLRSFAKLLFVSFVFNNIN